MDIFIRTAEGCAAPLNYLWDTQWQGDGGFGDWALQGLTASHNAGGLTADRTLETAVIIALFTDRAVPAQHPLARFSDGDRRGWWGDAPAMRTDDGETEWGSLLWLLERSIATPEIARWAEVFAIDAMGPIIRQGAAVRATARAVLLAARNGMTLDVGLYGRDGATVFDRKFDVLWRQVGL